MGVYFWVITPILVMVFTSYIVTHSHAHVRLNPQVSSNDLQETFRKLNDDVNLHPINLQYVDYIQELKRFHFELNIEVISLHLNVQLEGNDIYNAYGVKHKATNLHAGVHVIVLHPMTGQVLLKRHFVTNQPSETRNLWHCLVSIQPKRLLIISTVGNGSNYLSKDVIQLLSILGSSMFQKLALFESWLLVVHIPDWWKELLLNTKMLTIPHIHMKMIDHELDWLNGKVRPSTIHIEALVQEHHMAGASKPLNISTYVYKSEDIVCEWHHQKGFEIQRQFCEIYEGYGRLCACENYIHASNYKYMAPIIEIVEVIPVAMLTAVKAFNFYRQLVNLLETPGASQTPIVVMIDGYNKEISDICKLFNIPVLVHGPQGSPGSNTRLNMHFRFSVYNAVKYFPNVTKVIILEDDLILAPDFISYFQQTAWLLDNDPTIFCINAFSLNSMSQIAEDPTLLRRTEMYPQFGWMITRDWVQNQLPKWIDEDGISDWDWWLTSEDNRQKMDTIQPEVSRTFHAGSAGAHVTGWEQEHLFSQIFINDDPKVKLKDVHLMVKAIYDENFKQEIIKANTISMFDPCGIPPLPEDLPGPFKVFIKSYSRQDEFEAFFLVAACLNGFTKDTRGIYRGVMQYTINHKTLYVIGCTASQYCESAIFPSAGLKVLTPSSRSVDLADARNFAWITRYQPGTFLRRSEPNSPEQQFQLDNFVIHHSTN